jgi:hypothetical protein
MPVSRFDGAGDVFGFLSIVTGAGGVGVVLALRPFIKTLCANWQERCRRKSYVKEEQARRETRMAEIEAGGKAEVARIKATGKVLTDLAKLEPEQLEPEQVERLQARLDRLRPPPDQIEPPAAS